MICIPSVKHCVENTYKQTYRYPPPSPLPSPHLPSHTYHNHYPPSPLLTPLPYHYYQHYTVV